MSKKKAAGVNAQDTQSKDTTKVYFAAIESLVPYARNARVHSPTQVSQLAASISEFGWTNPILADGNGVVAGHGRLAAARKLYESGSEIRLPNGEPIPHGTVPVLNCSGWDEAKRRAYVLADNKLAMNATWDYEMLGVELSSLDDAHVELSGFTVAELAQLTVQPETGVTDQSKEWVGMPEFEDSDPCFRKVVVSFDSADDVADFFKLIGQSFTDKTKSIWHPFKKNRDLKSSKWGDARDTSDA